MQSVQCAFKLAQGELTIVGSSAQCECGDKPRNDAPPAYQQVSDFLLLSLFLCRSISSTCRIGSRFLKTDRGERKTERERERERKKDREILPSVLEHRVYSGIQPLASRDQHGTATTTCSR